MRNDRWENGLWKKWADELWKQRELTEAIKAERDDIDIPTGRHNLGRRYRKEKGHTGRKGKENITEKEI